MSDPATRRTLSAQDALRDPLHLHNALHLEPFREVFFPHADSATLYRDEGGRVRLRFRCGEEAATPRFLDVGDLLLYDVALRQLERALLLPEDDED